MAKKGSGESRSKYKTMYDFSKCPVCGGGGWHNYKAPPDRYEKMYREGTLLNYAEVCPACKGYITGRAETAKKNSNIPTVFYDMDYCSFNWTVYRDHVGNIIDTTRYKEIVESLIKNYMAWKAKGYGLYIHSKTKGSGKTFLASCICNELMKLYGVKTRFISATQLLDISKSGDKDAPDQYKREPVKLLCDCELLVIDDIGQKRTGGDWLNEVLFRIVDDRMTKGLVTIFTSNIPINELWIDDRITERINKMSFSLNLPEFNVRSREAYKEKLEFVKSIGLDEIGGE